MNNEAEDSRAILSCIKSMRRILNGIKGALRKNDIAERDAILEKLQKDLEEMKIPPFRFY